MIGNEDGKLHVKHQVQDYALRGFEFEMLGFLTFIVETYERQIPKDRMNNEDDNGSASVNVRTKHGHYLNDHPRCHTHMCIARCENHNFLPNIVGSWFPQRDGDDDTKSYYYASMLTLLKPWRNLLDLKNEDESWQWAFNLYMQDASQRDKDVIAGCQYYYDSREVAQEKLSDVDEDIAVDYEVNLGHDDDSVDGNNVEGGSTITSVSGIFVFLIFHLNYINRT